MPKLKRNPQFKANEDRIRQYLSDRKISPSKKSIHIEEYVWVLEFLEQEATARELEPSQMIRWLVWWFIKNKTGFPIEIEGYKVKMVTPEDLGFKNQYELDNAQKRYNAMNPR
jgi:hypothetical protein